MIELLKILRRRGKLQIRQRMMLIVLSIGIVTLIISSVVAFYGMIGAKNMAITTADKIGRQSEKNSSEILMEQTKSELRKLTQDKADDIDYGLKDLSCEVTSIALEMQRIFKNRSQFLPQFVNEPSQIQAGQLNFYIQHGKDFNRADFSDEIALTANIKDFLSGVLERKPVVNSVFVASRNNFTLSVDDNRENTAENLSVPNLIYEAISSDWYQKAISERKIIFTDVREFIFSKRLGLFCATPYYDENNEIAGVACAQATLERINRLLKEVELSKTGFCFVADNRGFIILNSAENAPAELSENLEIDIRNSANENLAEFAKKMVAGQEGVAELTLNGKDYYISYAPIETTGWAFGAAVAKEEIFQPVVKNSEIIDTLTNENISKLNAHLFQTSIGMIICISILLISVAYSGRRLSNHFVKPIHELSDGVREIASGNLDKKIDIRTGDEIEHLAICFNTMTEELKKQIENLTKITAEKERIATELDVAKNIQVSMLPHDFNFNRDDFEIYATMNAAKEVGGDFYDFYFLDENHLVVTIADVSGKGIPAALFMMTAKTILKNFSMTMNNPDDFAAVMTLANNQLCQNNDAMMFVTVFIGMLNLKTGEFIFVNGGHNPPVIYHSAENSCEYLSVKKNFVLGGIEDIDYMQQSIQLQKGDKIFLYTDGVTEALNKQEELYGEKRLLDCLNLADKNLTVEELLPFIRADVQKHVDGAEQSDDMTMLILKFNG